MEVRIDPRDGFACPEARVQDTVRGFIERAESHGDEIPAIGQIELLHEFRLLVKRGQISNLVFVFGGERIQVHGNGRLPNWPAGFLGSLCDNQLTELIG
jgi:hypothetical protein